ncbi:MAG TPA: 4-(cytidine 5'-diphospho)-2-C-methyl-D-erythritol kinase [Xanthobacteraceae bacterium]|nr:4-(cytidine 5'-diphospho)-2-C-methyl-D-erythritol kinase [Xanthobacteraceae bacterium]
MSATLLEKAAAKINLTLRVIGRRADGYHDLESLVAFADVTDVLTLQPGVEETLDVSGPFASKSGAVADNLVLKALGALRQRVTGLKGGRFLLEKNVPVAAGLGGGSADAAAALRLIARANTMNWDDPRLLDAARAVGADVPVCLDPRPRLMRGVGEVLSPPLKLPVLPAVLVNPGVALATRDVFAKFTGGLGGDELTDVPREFDALIECLDQHGNDLTGAALACAPVVAEVLAALKTLLSAKLVRMSGSGSSCFALFATQRDAAEGARRLAAEQKGWWVRATSLGAAPGVS